MENPQIGRKRTKRRIWRCSSISQLTVQYGTFVLQDVLQYYVDVFIFHFLVNVVYWCNIFSTNLHCLLRFQIAPFAGLFGNASKAISWYAFAEIHFSLAPHFSKGLLCISTPLSYTIITPLWRFCYVVFNSHMFNATEIQLWKWCFLIKFLLFMRPVHLWRSRTPDGIRCAHFSRVLSQQ
jgi:hypothetical protein